MRELRAGLSVSKATWARRGEQGRTWDSWCRCLLLDLDRSRDRLLRRRDDRRRLLVLHRSLDLDRLQRRLRLRVNDLVALDGRRRLDRLRLVHPARARALLRRARHDGRSCRRFGLRRHLLARRRCWRRCTRRGLVARDDGRGAVDGDGRRRKAARRRRRREGRLVDDARYRIDDRGGRRLVYVGRNGGRSSCGRRRNRLVLGSDGRAGLLGGRGGVALRDVVDRRERDVGVVRRRRRDRRLVERERVLSRRVVLLDRRCCGLDDDGLIEAGHVGDRRGRRSRLVVESGRGGRLVCCCGGER